MNGFIKKGAVVVLAGMLLTGCGDTLTTMTEKEEATVVNYSAGMIAKFNTRQADGIVGLKQQEKEMEESEQKEPSKESAAEEKDKSDTAGEKSEDSNKDKNPSSQEQDIQKSTMAEAFSISGLEFKYDGYEVSDNYRSSDIFSMPTASEGKTYLVLNVTISNSGGQDVECDLLSKSPIFLLKLNEESDVKNKMTFLTDDLSTFKDTIRAGSKAQTFLIFEVSADAAANISTIGLNLNINGKSSNVEL